MHLSTFAADCKDYFSVVLAVSGKAFLLVLQSSFCFVASTYVSPRGVEKAFQSLLAWGPLNPRVLLRKTVGQWGWYLWDN